MKTLIAAFLAVTACGMAASVGTNIPFPGTNNIQTGLISTFPTGTFTANNSLATPFAISSNPGNCGPGGASPCNFYDGFKSSGQSLTINLSLPNATDVYTLMNAYAPPNGVQVATIQFIGTGGASVTFPLIGGENIRDFLAGNFAKTLTNGVSGMEALNAFTCVAPGACAGAGGTGDVKTGYAGTYNVDEQHFTLPAAFQGQTLTQIIITDTNSSSTPILLGMTIATPAPPSPAINTGGVLSAAAFGGFSSAAPGSWIEIYGANLATTTRPWASTDFAGSTAPTNLSGTTVTIGGQPAFVDYVSPTQVNAQIPSNVATGPQPLVVNAPYASTAPYTLNINAIEPGLLAPSSFLVGGTQYVVALETDGVTYVLPPGAIAGVTSARAKVGQTIVMYGIGFGTVTPGIPAGQIAAGSNSLNATLQIFIGGQLATVSYQGLAPGLVGLYQFNVVVPPVAASDKVPVTFSLGGTQGTQTLYLAVGS